MATTLNISGLTEYVDQKRDELLVNAIAGDRVLDYVELMPDVKYKSALHYLDSEIVLQKASCGWSPAGSDTLSERFVEVVPVEVEKEWCYLDFLKYYTAYQMKIEAGRESMPFEEAFANSNMAKVQEALNEMLFQGNSALTVTGWINDIKEVSGDTVEFATGATVVEKVDAMVAACTAKMLKKGVNIFMSFTDFRNYVQESNGTCCANRPVLDAASNSITYAGDSRIKLIPVYGLEGTGAIIASTPDALVYATDVEGSETVYRLWFDEKEQKFMFRVIFNAGTAVKWIDEAILGD